MEKLIIFTRHPEPGITKTRLISALGAEGAADLHRRMTEHTVRRLRPIHSHRSVSMEIRYDGRDEVSMRGWLGSELDYRPQGGGNLGERMARAFQESFRDGARAVVLVGTDCPEIIPDSIRSAFGAIDRQTVVFGRAADGGYYLVGLGKEAPEIFSDVVWGTEAVLGTFIRLARGLGLTIRLLDRLEDVDRPEDLGVWDRVRAAERISVVIPALNEAGNIDRAIGSAQRGADVEIIVVDGESRDGTADLARAHGVQVVIMSPDRARQMNAGADRASGGILLFLHGDCRLPKAFDRDIRGALVESGIVGGAFHLKIDLLSRGIRLIEWLGDWRSRQWDLPYGDQGIFVRSDIFRELGGFPQMAIMEDFAFMRDFARRGRVVILPACVTADGRRWKKRGVVRTTLINQAMIAAHALGVSPKTMARWYGREKGIS